MADKPLPKATTHKMEALKAQELLPKKPHQVGKRVFDRAEQRGLAAFDSEPEKAAAGKKPRDDDADLRHARLDASEHDNDDDGMVVTSGSNWDDVMRGAPSAPPRKGRAKAPEPEVAEEEVEAAPPRRSAWKWVVGGLVVAGAGVGGFFGVSALVGNKAPEVVAETKPAPPPKPVVEEPEEEEPAAADAGAATDATEEAHAEVVAEKKGDAIEWRATPASSEPAPWAAAVLASNPWVDVAPASGSVVLGLSEEAASDGLAASRTGFRPAAKINAPTTAFRLQTHEVTWGELAQATLPEVSALAPPSWAPSDAKRRANLPATGVPWAVADAFCRGLGGDLPSEAEWEWAARGPELRHYPWGRDAFSLSEVHIVSGGKVPVVPVMTSKIDRTPGPTPLWDLLGNAQEWTRDPWRASEPTAAHDPKAPTHRAVRGWPLADPGGSSPADGATYRAPACAAPGCQSEPIDRIGFRCVHG